MLSQSGFLISSSVSSPQASISCLQHFFLNTIFVLVNPNFCFYYTNKLLFSNQSHIAINLLTCLPCWPSDLAVMCLSYRGCLCFKYFAYFWEAARLSICCWKCSWFEHFENFTSLLFIMFYIHLTCTYHVRPVPILSMFFFLTYLCFNVLNSFDMRLSCR